ncbi:MAG: hypothetical protein COZ06_27400 [Armatimonadetes bacterium CG_4_10_14_3_um_filter_66_18]|nr:hypothetical protein [Armatimonadota bacterium]OIO96368.1 MAG: hypothetical protein AUJ96_24855 [Armatimonadetes bacterium CG2_30_66_41]PIU88147.1 MAG: hypothetical protein COS65_31255 [Armatimonadetes bacterium CG06_land_8_20_14_3_00_66_21]PIX43851.1 MAG: hypothetical protein COZ57_18450 [Armatimonadetes bacterium CG_4_8_14_3_um_filter_66_20]PIY40963.1 MAG: hypothetical protein COZ06_27400 [Armatimonadetes bacterium CG_4_10_14_3_um_filter_66_18]PJB61961.1 MAG: hypothetical protein CO096_26
MGVQDYLQGVCTLTLTGVAVWGISAWRREFIGKRRTELAEEVLALFYECRDIVHQMRNPFIYEGEDDDCRRSEPGEAAGRAADTGILTWRYMQRAATFAKLQSLRYRCMALFGKQVAESFDELAKLVRELLLAERAHTDLLSEATDVTGVSRRELAPEIQRVSAFLGRGAGAEDTVPLRLDNLVDQIEKICSKHIR